MMELISNPDDPILWRIVSIVTGVVGWLAGRRKNVAEVEMKEINNLKSIIQAQQQSINFMQSQIDYLQAEITEFLNKR